MGSISNEVVNKSRGHTKFRYVVGISSNRSKVLENIPSVNVIDIISFSVFELKASTSFINNDENDTPLLSSFTGVLDTNVYNDQFLIRWSGFNKSRGHTKFWMLLALVLIDL